MGIENMRRWPVYIVFAVCFLLSISLFNSWNLETELRNRITDVSRQLFDCAKQQKSCMEESLALMQQKEELQSKLSGAGRDKEKLNDILDTNKDKLSKAEKQVNSTLMDMELCKTELNSLKSLEMSKSATLETLRFEKETLTAELKKRSNKISDLEKEIEKLKTALATKSDLNDILVQNKNLNVVKSEASLKISTKSSTQSPQLLKLSPQLVIKNPLEENLEDNAKEELEDNVLDGNGNPDINDPNEVDFDQQVQ